ncbi:hypothetical protein [Solimonas variicoloris]|uniref:hypothetical protein n=1 Tax=Solimonas variicoloris TaxID=254408 RepID=UPI000378E246|nr:hypothetical protein [Solimonas variicoloris]
MKTRHTPERWLALAVLACTLQACGGHSDVDETPAPVPSTLHCAPEPVAGTSSRTAVPATACPPTAEALS